MKEDRYIQKKKETLDDRKNSKSNEKTLTK